MKVKGIVSAFLILAACQSEDTDAMVQQVIEADKSFSKMATEKGIAEAFIFYADEKVIKPSYGRQPTFGKYALIQSYNENPPDYALTWKPIKAEASGNLAYTFGSFTLITKNDSGKDTTIYGNYVSIWKRKKDGSWRYVLDTGNPTPEPVVLK